MAESFMAKLFSAIESTKRRVKNNFTDEGLGQTADVINEKLKNIGSTDPKVLAEAIPDFIGGGAGTIGSATRVLGPEAAFQAQKLMAKGLDNAEIFAKTKAYAGPIDKQLRAVISDENMKLLDTGVQRLQETGKARMKDIVDHPELYKAYPGLQQVDVELRNLGHEAAAYKFDPATMKETIFLDPSSVNHKNIYGHELQHAIQEFEDFTKGGNPRVMIQHPQYGDFVSQHSDELMQEKAKHPEQSIMNIISNSMYKLLGGEAEARAVEKQIQTGDYTSFPLDLYDVDPSKILKDMRSK